MRAALLAGALVVLPGAWFVAQGELLRWLGDGEPPRLLRPRRRTGPRVARAATSSPRSSSRPCSSRSSCAGSRPRSSRVEESDAPHRAARLRAVVAAYDQLLLQLCESLGVETHVGLPPLPSGERLALEAELVAAGHEW